MKRKIISLLILLISTLIFMPLTKLFVVNNLLLQIMLSLFSAVVLYPLIAQVYKYFRLKESRQALQFFLQVSISHLNSGDSLQHAMIKALQVLEKNKRILTRPKHLSMAKQGLQLNKNFQENLILLSELFTCPESKIIFSLLRNPNLLGKQIKGTLQNFEVNLRDTIKRNETQMAEQTKSLVESLLLLLMPVLIILFIKNGSPDFYENAFKTLVGQLLFLVAYLLFSSSVLFIQKVYFPKSKTFNISQKHAPSKGNGSQSNLLLLFPLRKLIEKSLQFYSLHGTIQKSVMRQMQNKKRIRFLVYAILIFITLTYANLPYYLGIIISFAIFIYPDYRLIENYREYRSYQIGALGPFFQYIILCLKSGMSVQFAINTANENLGADFPLRVEIKRMNIELANKNSLENTLTQFAHNLDIPEVIMYFQILLLHSHSGFKQDIDILELQTQQFQHILEEEKRKINLRKSNFYIVPMVMNLLSVMLISIAPIIQYFQF